MDLPVRDRVQIDSDGESATKNKNITDEFAKAGWVGLHLCMNRLSP